MKTIFLNGVMLDRCSIFVKMLAREFKVAGPGLNPLDSEPELNFVDSDKISGRPSPGQVKDLARKIVEQSAVLAGSLADDLPFSLQGPEPGWTIPEGMIKSDLIPRVERVLGLELNFRNFLANHPVDMVVSGSDYSSHSRMIVLAAKELGIPTLNIEHGFFFSRFKWELSETETALPTLFTSDYANLDNALEVEGFSQEAEFFPNVKTKFLALGTPVETVASNKMDQNEAISALGLNRKKKRVLLLGSWIEARAVNSLINGQIDIIEAYEDLLLSLSKTDFHQEMEFLIKVHPADGHPEVYPGLKAAIEQMAARAGLPQPKVFKDNLAEVLSASDVVVSLGFSSVLFDVFQMGKQSLVILPRFLDNSTRKNWQHELSVPLEEGVIAVADDGADLWRMIEDCFQPDRQKKLQARVDSLTRRYGLQYRSVEDKSAGIVSWIKQHLSEADPATSPNN